MYLLSSIIVCLSQNQNTSPTAPTPSPPTFSIDQMETFFENQPFSPEGFGCSWTTLRIKWGSNPCYNGTYVLNENNGLVSYVYSGGGECKGHIIQVPFVVSSIDGITPTNIMSSTAFFWVFKKGEFTGLNQMIISDPSLTPTFRLFFSETNILGFFFGPIQDQNNFGISSPRLQDVDLSIVTNDTFNENATTVSDTIDDTFKLTGECKSDDDNSLTTGAIVGISIAGVAGVGVGVFFVIKQIQNSVTATKVGERLIGNF